MKNPALVASGTGVILFGVAASVAGVFTTWFAVNCSQCVNPPGGVMIGLAGAVDLIAASGVGGGIAMIAIGARRVPIESAVGGTCSVTSDCADKQHCIDGRCRSLEPPATTSATQDATRPTTVSGAIMLGDGRGYVVPAIITDLCAFLTTIPPWMVAYAADASRFGVGFQIAPLAVQLAAGPALHLFKGRIGPALISLLGWTTVAMTTFFVPTVVSPNGDRPNGLAAGTAMLATGGIAMTIVDAFMARPAPKRIIDRPDTMTWAPTLSPVPGGAMTGIAGSW